MVGSFAMFSKKNFQTVPSEFKKKKNSAQKAVSYFEQRKF